MRESDFFFNYIFLLYFFIIFLIIFLIFNEETFPSEHIALIGSMMLTSEGDSNVERAIHEAGSNYCSTSIETIRVPFF